MNRWAIAALIGLAACARCEKILLVPLDSRPAAGQFAQMIGRMGNVEVALPPMELLGRYTEPGKPDAILDWLEKSDFTDVTAVILSTDMICYGGLIASRVPDTPIYTALGRLNRLSEIRRRYPSARFYAYSAIMRLYPTATRETAAWRLQLGRYMELYDRFIRTKNPIHRERMASFLPRIPPLEIVRYKNARQRDHLIQRTLLSMVAENVFDYLILGQDDAQPYGPHMPEQQDLRKSFDSLLISRKVYLCEGIDQHANVLISRALLRENSWVPRVRIVYSDNAGRGRIADYESKSIGLSLQDQLLASGAGMATPGGQYDYTLFLNIPNPRLELFDRFLNQLKEEVDQGFPVSVADINLGKDGTGDPRLFAGLSENKRMMKLLSYAGWNTAGNSMGTAIPAANVYLLARKLRTDPLGRELAQREFLLHRFVNDFQYHKYTRPAAYRIIDAMPRASREETYGDDFDKVNSFVQKDLAQRLQNTFKEQFLDKRFFAGDVEYKVSGISDVNVFLPWPRAYEVSLQFRMKALPVSLARLPRWLIPFTIR